MFRTVDIEIVGTTARHLTFFEMLGNFSFGDYFKREAQSGSPGRLSTEGFGFKPDDIWITVFAGDEELGIGPDEEAIDAWLEIGVPRERIVECPREENFWQSGPTGPVRPVLGALPRPRRRARQAPTTCPGGENERFLEYWNLVFMQFDQNPDGRAHAAAGQEHRHRPGSQPHGLHPAGRGDGVRDRPVRAADRARRGAVGPPLRRATSPPTGRCGCSPTTAAR